MSAAYHKEIRFEFNGDEGAAQSRIPRARVLVGMVFETNALGTGYIHRRIIDQDGAEYEIHIVAGQPPIVHIDVAKAGTEERPEPLELTRLLWMPEGFYLTPKRDSDAKWGWGAPRRQVNGELINPPFGTAYNGDEDEGALKQVIINRYKNNKYIEPLANSLSEEVAEMGSVSRVSSAAINFYDFEIIGWYRTGSGGELPMLRQFLFSGDIEENEHEDEDNPYYYRFQPVFYEQERDQWFCHWPEEIYNPESFEEYSYRYIESVRAQGHAGGGGSGADYEPLTRPMRGFNVDLADKILELMRANTLIAHDSPEYAEEYSTFGRRVSAFGSVYSAGENLQFLPRTMLQDMTTTQEYARVSILRYANSPDHLQTMVYPWTDQEANLSGSVRIAQAGGTRVVGDDAYTGAYNASVFVAQRYSVQPNYPTQQLENHDVGLLADDGQDIPRYEHRFLDTFGSELAVFNRVILLTETVLGAGVWRDPDTGRLWLVWLDWHEDAFRLRGTLWGVRYVAVRQVDEDSIITFASHTSVEDVVSVTRALFSADGSKCVIQYAYKLGVVNSYIQPTQKNFNIKSDAWGGVPMGYEGLRVVELTVSDQVTTVADNQPMISVTASSEELQPGKVPRVGDDDDPLWENIYSAHCSDVITCYPAYDGNNLVTCSILVEMHYDAYSEFRNPGDPDFVEWGSSTDTVKVANQNDTSIISTRTLVFPDGTQHLFYNYKSNTVLPLEERHYFPENSWVDTISYMDPLKPEDTCYTRVHLEPEHAPQFGEKDYLIVGRHEVFLRNALVYTHPPIQRVSGSSFTNLDAIGPHTGQGLMCFTNAFGAILGMQSQRHNFYIPPALTARLIKVGDFASRIETPIICGSSEVSHYPGNVPNADYGFSFTQGAGCTRDLNHWHSTNILPFPSEVVLGGVARNKQRAAVVRYKGEMVAAMELVSVFAAFRYVTDDEPTYGIDYEFQEDQTGRFFVESSLDLEELTGVQGLSPDIWPFGRI